MAQLCQCKTTVNLEEKNMTFRTAVRFLPCACEHQRLQFYPNRQLENSCRNVFDFEETSNESSGPAHTGRVMRVATIMFTVLLLLSRV